MVDEVEFNWLTIWNLFFKACVSCLYSLELPEWESFIYETCKWQIELWKVILTIKGKWLNARGSRWEWSFLELWKVILTIKGKWLNAHGSRWEWSFLELWKVHSLTFRTIKGKWLNAHGSKGEWSFLELWKVILTIKEKWLNS